MTDLAERDLTTESKGERTRRRILEIAIERFGERGYRVVTGDDDPEERQLIGYFRRLRAACERAHKHWLAAQARPGGVNGS